MSRLSGKVVVVLGGARGIGLTSVQQMLLEGATVFVGDIREPSAEIDHGSFTSRIIDATDEGDIREFIDEILQVTGRIDVLFCNVGVHLGKDIADTTVEEFEGIFAINVRSAFLACRAVIPSMRARRNGNIIITSSNGGLMGRPGDPVYNATKHALVGLAKSLAVAYAQDGIRVNTINPGAIDTDMLRGSASTLSDEFQKKVSASTPAARVGSPLEVANTVVFLASDESRFINGISLAIDGAKSAGALPAARYSENFDLQYYQTSSSDR